MKIFPRYFPAALILAAFSPAVQGADEAKPYTLFMGTDFSVQYEKEYYRVRDVVGGTFVIRVKEDEIRIPMRTGSGTLKVDQGLKLSPASAQIAKLQTERTYTKENDPYRKFNSQASSVMGTDAQLSINYSALSSAMNRFGQAGAQANRVAGTPSAASAAEELSSAGAAMNAANDAYAGTANQMVMVDLNNPGLAALELQYELAEENFDAMRYSFEVSSPVPLNRPYVVFIVHFHEKDAKPGTKKGTVVYAKAIEPIGDRPAKINILQTGMPIGFIVEECQVRLYNGGQEIATNVAPRRVEMTRDDAFLYLKIDRIGRAKGVSLPAAPALGRLDEEAKSRLTLDQQKGTYYVKVSKEGLPEGVFTDPACAHPADPAVSAVVEEMRFYPALEKNKEQAGVAKLVFAQVPI